MGFSRQAYWSGLPFPSPGDLADPGIECASPALAGGFFSIEPPREAPLGRQKTQKIINNMQIEQHPQSNFRKLVL